jgi:hypothetical protein
LEQLLVNKTLYEKTLASGFGSVHFLLDASQQQQVCPPLLFGSDTPNASMLTLITSQALGA